MFFLTIGVARAICPASAIVHLRAASAVVFCKWFFLRIAARGQSKTANQSEN
jgi:hypothetical protein